MRSSYKYLFKNIGLLTLSNFATKLLSFFLVPLYTNVLTTTEYGTYDLFSTTIGILLPILTLNIRDAVMRFAMDKKYSREAIVSTAMRFFLFSLVVISIGLVANYVFGFSQLGKDYAIFFFLMFFVQSLSEILFYYIRGIDKIADLSISSVWTTVTTIGCNILFLVIFKWGLVGYFLANIIGPFTQCIYLIARTNVIKCIHFSRKYISEQKEMLTYSKPMIANTIAWWVNNASDRYIVIFFCGLAENGIYSVASKIPSILNIFQTIFNQAWTLSVVKDFDSEDKNGFFANTYKSYNCFMTILCSIIIVGDKILARFLYAKEFYVAWKCVPWLTIAIIFGALSGYLGGFFSAVKNSKIFAQSTVIGAIINIILNVIFTPLIGILGAAIATAVCYFVVWLIRYYNAMRIINMKINLCRDLFTYFLLGVQAVVLLTVNSMGVYVVEIILLLIILALYGKDIVLAVKTILSKKTVRLIK